MKIIVVYLLPPAGMTYIMLFGTCLMEKYLSPTAVWNISPMSLQSAQTTKMLI